MKKLTTSILVLMISQVTWLFAQQVSFQFSPPAGCVPHQVSFTNTSDPGFTGVLWNFGDGLTSTDVNPIHFYTAPGMYFVTLTATYPTGQVSFTDSLGIIVDQMFVSINSTNVSCFGGSNGTATVVAQSMFGGFIGCIWSNGSTPNSIIGLSSGNYVVTVTNQFGCVEVTSVTILEPSSQLGVYMDILAIPDCGQNNGTIQAVASGGMPPYHYSWTAGLSSYDVLDFVGSGLYAVTVTDAYGCQIIDNVYLPANSGFQVTTSVTEPNCGQNNGAISLSVVSANPPVSFSWGHDAQLTDSFATGLAPGIYQIFLMDSFPCADTVTVTLNAVGGPQLNPVVVQLTCPQFPGGSIDLNISGGTPPYTILWSNGATTEQISSLTAGNYSATITDNAGCQSFFNHNLAYQPLNVQASAQHITCNSIDITASVANGVPPYTFEWNTGTTGPILSGAVYNQSYGVTVTESGGCQKIKPVRFNYPAQCFNSVRGFTFSDTDQDCFQSAGESFLVSRVEAYKGAVSKGVAYSMDSMGYVWSIIDTGLFHLVFKGPSGYSGHPNCSDTVWVQFDSIGVHYNQRNMPMDITPLLDVAVNLNCGVATPGFTQIITLQVQNLHLIPFTGVLTFRPDSILRPFNFNILPNFHPSFQNMTYDSVDHVLTWDVVNFMPIQTVIIPIQIFLPLPQVLPMGYLLQHSASILPDANDIQPLNNRTSCAIFVTNAWDPNDKQVSPVGWDEFGSITQGDSLMFYLIRFQNTGTDTAHTVIIRDTLDANLNWSSFQPVSWSHPVEVSMEADNVAKFLFENILLPDSNVNEPASHGHVSFYIKHKGTLPLGTEIHNRAGIYFDYNNPIITNTVVNRISEPVGVAAAVSPDAGVRIFPNPGNDFVYLLTHKEMEQAVVYDLAGRTVLNLRLNQPTNQQIIRTETLENGLYFITVSGIGWKQTLRWLKAE